MDVRDRSTYTPSLESTGVESGLRTDARPMTPTSASAASGHDSSDLSPTARMASQAMQLPEVRQDRVASLQQQIASGTYSVAPQDVADAVLRNLRG